MGGRNLQLCRLAPEVDPYQALYNLVDSFRYGNRPSLASGVLRKAGADTRCAMAPLIHTW